jgi:Concanavalin A-like lectin/glucanases superfamily
MNRKERLLFALPVCFLLLATVFLRAQVPGYLPTSGMVACYTLAGNANDVSGNGNDGIATGLVPTSDRFFQPGSASLFSGQTIVDCGNDSSLDVDDCTLAAWVRVSDDSIFRQTILAKSDSASQGSYAMSLAYNRFQVRLYYDMFELQLDCFAPIIVQSTWYHLVATHSSVYGVNLYVNGALARSSPVTGHLRQGMASNHLRIGAWGIAGTDPIQGAKLDDVAIWNYAIGTEEIEEMYLLGITDIEARHRESNFSIHPNPASDHARLRATADLIGEEWRIMDALGRVIQMGAITDVSTSISLDGYLPGIYMVQVGSRPAQKWILQ